VSGSLLLWLALVALAGAFGLVVVLLAGGSAATASGPVARGLTAIERQYGAVIAPVAGPLPGRELSPPLDRLRKVAVRISPTSVVDRLHRRLDLAGNPGHWTAERVLAFKGLGLLLGVTGGLLLGLGSPLRTLLVPAVAGLAGFFLPDVLDLLTVCVEAGLGFDAAIDEVAKNTTGPLAGELTRLLKEMQLGQSRVDALRALAERTDVRELGAFVSALVQASQLGIPVAGVLREQAGEMRLRRQQRAEEQAQKVPVKILFPVIFFLMPALFVVIIGPGALSIMHAFGGH
jgi:tight adherence protein C